MKIDNFNSLLVIKRVAKEKGITMAEIAEKIGISPINLSTSLNNNPTLKRLKEVADILGVPVRELFKDEDVVRGYVELDGHIERIECYADLVKMLERTRQLYIELGLPLHRER